MVTGIPTCLANDEWLSKPFPCETRSANRIINDTLLSIPKYLSELQYELSSALDPCERNRAEQEFLQKIDCMKRDLDQLHVHILQFLQSMPLGQGSTPASIIATAEFNLEGECLYNFTSPIHAKTVAMHACATITVLGILSSTNLSLSHKSCFFPIEDYRDENIIFQIEEASKRIISASQYLSRFAIGCAHVRMILPLQLVGQASTNPAQRARARMILESWYKDTPVKGLTRLAMQAIDTPA